MKMNLENKQLGERYKKLKQPDRMEYLAINSIYENKENTYQNVLFILYGITIFIMLFFAFILISIAGALAVEDLSVNDFIQDSLETSVGDMIVMFLFAFVISMVEIIMIILLYRNDKERNKILEEFLLERKIK